MVLDLNTPNKLTLLRVFLVPLFMVFLLVTVMPHHMLWAALCFVLASITDFIDGRLARRSNQVTTFGKFLDPLADKLLVTAALVCFVQLGLTDSWVAMIIIGREFLVTLLRLVAAGDGTVFAANLWGKAKTASQMIAIIAVMLFNGFGPTPEMLTVVGSVLLWVAAVLTVVSGVQYVWLYRGHIDTRS